MIYLSEGVMKDWVMKQSSYPACGKKFIGRNCKKKKNCSYSTDLLVRSNMMLSTPDTEVPSSIHQNLKTSTSVAKQGTKKLL